jgi:predicted PurR-regulated permease PerM
MPDDHAQDRAFLTRSVEAAIRIAAVAGLAVWCFDIVRPFLQPVLWAVVIGVAVHPLQRRLESRLGGRPRAAAATITVLALVFLITPAALLTGSLMDTTLELSSDLREGRISVPPPPSGVADWPVIGDRLHVTWLLASQNLEALLQQYAPQVRAAATTIVTTAAATGMGVLKFVLSVLIAGVLLANAKACRGAADAIATRLIGERGPGLTDLSVSTIQGVSRSILVVALLQSLLTGIGCMLFGVPGAGLWAVVVLLVAVVQLPILIVTLPLVLYVFSTSSTGLAVAFLGWNLLVGLSDNVLKPLLMGRGMDVPMIVIFIGSIGGFVLDGIIGLFIGAVVLALGYNVFLAWLALADASDTAVDTSTPLP